MTDEVVLSNFNTSYLHWPFTLVIWGINPKILIGATKL